MRDLRQDMQLAYWRRRSPPSLGRQKGTGKFAASRFWQNSLFGGLSRLGNKHVRSGDVAQWKREFTKDLGYALSPEGPLRPTIAEIREQQQLADESGSANTAISDGGALRSEAAGRHAILAGRGGSGAVPLAPVDAWASRLRIPRRRRNQARARVRRLSVVGRTAPPCGQQEPPPPPRRRSWRVEATVRTRPRPVDGQNAAGSAFSRRPSTNPGQLVPTNFRLWVSGPGGMTEHDHLESAARQAAR